MKRTILLILLTFLIVNFTYAEEQSHDSSSGLSGETTLLKRYKAKKGYDMTSQLYAGEQVNYQSYKLTSPLIGLGFGIGGHYWLSKHWLLRGDYKIRVKSFFSDVNQSKSKLNEYKNKLKGALSFEQKKYRVALTMKAAFVARPNWPDLYQPVPFRYSANFNLNDIALAPTDRYSYNRLNPELLYVYRFSKRMPVFAKVGYKRTSGTVDPNYSVRVPTHLIPKDTSEIYESLGIKYRLKNMPVRFAFILGFSQLSSNNEFARDDVTGKTHYAGKNPNPYYNESAVMARFELKYRIKSLGFSIAPFYQLTNATDAYKGYYTYLEHQPGIGFKESLLKKTLILKAEVSKAFRNFTSKAYGLSKSHLALSSGNVLFKYYTNLSLSTKYYFAKNFNFFARFNMIIKDTNYPSYVPGVMPTSGTKNYNIDFAYDNYIFRSGFSWRLSGYKKKST